MKQKPKPKNISELGEFGLIDQLTGSFSNKNPSSFFGVGDDCAVIERDLKTLTLLSTDVLLEGIHFDLMYVPLKHLGFKAVSANVSDIYAMNGKPEQILVGIALSSRFPIEAIEELYEGIKAGCDFYGVDLVGGDTSSSVSGLMLSITAVGQVDKDKIVYRTGASANDIIMVSGDLGAPYLGLQVLEREKMVFNSNPEIQPELEGYDYLIKKQLKPEARKDVIDMLEKLEIKPSSMIDISDGLASEIIHLTRANKLGAVIHEDKIPYHDSTMLVSNEFNVPPITCAMNGGEEYELLFSVSQNDFEKIKGNPLFTPIGYFTETEGGNYLMDGQGTLNEIKAQGWNHF